MPDVPTVGETVPGYVAQSWQGLFARAGTPKAIVEAVAAPLAADLKRPETVARFKAIGIVAQSDTPDKFRAFIAAESAKWGKVIRLRDRAGVAAHSTCWPKKRLSYRCTRAAVDPRPHVQSRKIKSRSI